MFRALRLCGVSCLVVAASACVDDAVPPSGPTRAKIIAQAQTDWSRAADLQISEAVRGRKERGEQETMLQIEARAPGFGGYYIDSTDQVVVHLKNNSESSATAVRHVLDSVYSRRGEPARSVMSRAFDAKVVPSAFALSELIAIEQHIYKSGVLRGMTGVGTSIVANRVKVGFENESAMEDGQVALRLLGVPDSAVIAEVWGVNVLTGNFDQRHDTTWAGLMICMQPPPGLDMWCGTHGYNVRDGNGNNYFLLSAHGPNGHYATNGKTGVLITQAILSDGAIGTVAVNPPWSTTGCGQDPSTGLTYPYCTFADVAAGTFSGGRPFVRKLGVSQTGGENGAPGSLNHNPTLWPVTYPYLEPEMVKQGFNVVHRTGMRTGTTTGAISTPCTYGLNARIRWGPSSLVFLEYKCATVVDHAGWGQGDSGGPVFARQFAGGPYRPLGLQVTGIGSQTSNGICNAGMLCKFVFQRWSFIEQQLGLGPLYPQL